MQPHFHPSREAGLEKLQAFLPRAGRSYATLRNYDLPGHPHVSGLSPYIRHRLITEEEVLAAVLGRFSLSSAEKFIQEVFWRTYWKGWLEMRPGIWSAYQAGLAAALNRVQCESGLRREWEAACNGATGLEPFDHWARELVETGYLHNHARMWFASIWIFTLRLPWELGADFFLRHLLDGDPASNTLSWRWVAGLQTRGKHYLARPANIEKYTNGRFGDAGSLNTYADPLSGPEHPTRRPVPDPGQPDGNLRSGFILTEEDLSPGFLASVMPSAGHLLVSAAPGRSPLHVSENVLDFTKQALDATSDRYAARLGPRAGMYHGDEAIPAARDWVRSEGLEQVIVPYAPVGPAADLLDRIEQDLASSGCRLCRIRRGFDSLAWPHATAGFFKFKKAIPDLLAVLPGLPAK